MHMPASMAGQLQRAAAGGLTAAISGLMTVISGSQPSMDDARLARLLGLCEAALRSRAALQRAAAGQQLGRLDPAWAPSGAVIGAVAPALKACGAALVGQLDAKSSVAGSVLNAFGRVISAVVEAEDVREQLNRCAPRLGGFFDAVEVNSERGVLNPEAFYAVHCWGPCARCTDCTTTRIGVQCTGYLAVQGWVSQLQQTSCFLIHHITNAKAAPMHHLAAAAHATGGGGRWSNRCYLPGNAV